MGPGTFCPISFHTIETHRLGGRSTYDAELSIAIQSDLELIPGRIGRQGFLVGLVYNPSRQKAFLDALDDWYTERPEPVYILSWTTITAVIVVRQHISPLSI